MAVIVEKDKRFYNEKILINYSIKKIPVLGICRGAQSLNLYFKGKLIKVENHVKKKHVLFDIKYKNNIC